MQTLTRKTPKTKEMKVMHLKTISYNEQGRLFLIYIDEDGDEEKLINLNENEAKRLISFVREKLK